MNFLPGMFPAVFSAEAVATVASLSFITSTNSVTSTTITAPATINAGDLLIMFDAVWDQSGPTPPSVIPSGFTLIVSTGNGVDQRVNISYKIADGTEDSASITGMVTQDESTKIIMQFRGDIPITSINLSTVNSEVTDGNPSAQSVTASGGTAPLIIIASMVASTSTTSGSFSPAEDGTVERQGVGLDMLTYYKIYNSSPANTTIDMGDEGFGNTLHSFYLEAA